MKMRKSMFALFLCAALLLSLAGCTKPQTAHTAKTELKAATTEPIHAAKDYEAVKAHFLREDDSASSYNYANTNEMFLTDGDAVSEPAADGVDYSDTNIQVDGVDEADIVKTDGKYIYSLFGSAIKIIRADGADTAVVCDLFLDLTSTEESSAGALELYLDASNLFVITQQTDWGSEENGWTWKETVNILVYDVSNPKTPTLKTTLGQDGYYHTSRLTNGVLYLVTDNQIYGIGADASAEDVIPCTYVNGTKTMLPAESVYLCPSSYDASMTTVGAYDCTKQALIDACSLTGGVNCVYMDADAVYIAQTVNEELSSEPYKENQYTVTDYKYVSTTDIHRVRIADGKLSPDATAAVDGYLLNQFAMDVYDGMLRVATTTRASAYSVFRDEAYDFENYVWDESVTSNALTVFDGNLEKLGEVTDLAEGETIYSVRFMGTTAYVVTYESIDPVFTIDLTTPAEPKVQSALELTGVSDYLQGYGEGLLFGFGRALDENASSNGLQLCMFDTADAANVKLIDKTVIEDVYSEALYNHKAILVSVEKNLIAFPGNGNSFYVYSYENSQFVQRACFDFAGADDYWAWSTSRGLYIGDCLYLVSDSAAYVADLTSFETVAHLNFAEG